MDLADFVGNSVTKFVESPDFLDVREDARLFFELVGHGSGIAVICENMRENFVVFHNRFAIREILDARKFVTIVFFFGLRK